MRSYLFFAVTLCLFISCSKETTDVSIRVENVSKLNFVNVMINSKGNEHNFADITAGGVTDYKTFPSAYKIAGVIMLINGELTTIQPIDYVGEEPLKSGKYTYKINAIKDVSGIIIPTMECVKD